MKTQPYKSETMKGVDFVTVATLVAEIGDIRRFANADKLVKFCGYQKGYKYSVWLMKSGKEYVHLEILQNNIS